MFSLEKLTAECVCFFFRPDFYTLYLDEPDSSGHRYGPESSQVRLFVNGSQKSQVEKGMLVCTEG